MIRWTVRDISRAGLLGALGLALPMLFHLVGLGKVFLPMHIPILAGGFLLPPSLALLLGFVIPPLSTLLTGMPPVVPTLPLMIWELASLGGVTALLYRRLKAGLWLSLLGGLIGDRLALLLAVFLLGNYLGINLPPWGYVVGAVATGLPGIALQLVVIPPIVYWMEKRQSAFLT